MLNNLYLKIGLGLFILAGFGSLIYFRLPKSSPVLASFLPQNTIFYYHHRAMPEALPLFDFSIITNNQNQLSTILAQDFGHVRDYIWFKIDNQDDYFLVDLSQEIKFSQPNFGFKDLDKNILLLGPSQAQVDALAIGGFESFGADIYWQLQNPPYFLQSFSQFVSPYFRGREIFANISQTDNIYNLKIFEIAQDNGQIASNSFIDMRLPQNQGLVFGFDPDHASSTGQFIKQNILDSFFSSLPLSNAVFRSNDGWLSIYKNDLKPRLIDFSKKLAVEELVKTLPDGSSYTELVAAKDKKPADLYEAELSGYYYLSNSQALIDQINNNYRLVSDLCISCQDFMQIQTDLLPESNLKTYLNRQNIHNLSAFSYKNSQTQGFELYFQ